MAYEVDFQRKDYQASLKDWCLVEDVCAGERVIKAAKEKYLPKPNPSDTSSDNTERYKQYVKRAVFYNATNRTKQGMTGTAFRKAPSVNLPPACEYLLTNANGTGVGLVQQSQKVLANLMEKGRAGLLVDYPNVGPAVSKETQERLAIRAMVILISAKDIINWQATQIGGVHKLSLVVIKEEIEEVSGFGAEAVTQYRVLKLVDNVYVVEIWQKDKDGQWFIKDSFTPLTGKGVPWSEIPFTFVGSQNNDADIDDIPLLDIARLNIAHYRNSADYEDSVYFCGQAQPYMTGMDRNWVTLMKDEGVYVGARQLMPVPGNGSFGFAQAQPNTLAFEALNHKEKQMASLGARLLDKGQSVKTATQSQHENEVEHSVLSLCVANVTKAYESVISWVMEFNRVDGDFTFELSTEFVEQSMDAQMLTALVGAWQSGTLPESDLWAQYRKKGLIESDKDDEAIKDELETSGLGLSSGSE